MKILKRGAVFAVSALMLLGVWLMPTAVGAVSANETTAEVSAAGSGLKIEPSLVVEASSQAAVDGIASSSVKPAVAVFTVDADMNVIFGENKTPLADAIALLGGKTIPAVRIEDQTVKAAFISYMTDSLYIRDIAVVSSDIEILDDIYRDEICYTAIGVYDLTETALPDNRYDFFDAIGAANAAGCNILLVSAADGNLAEIAEYTAAMSKVCWAAAEGAKQVTAAIAAGCYGVVSDDITALTDGLAAFTEDGFARAQFIAAHRGITAYANENSLTSLAAAANEGATHVEVDLQVTSDGNIVLCHNSDAGATSTADNSTWVANNSVKKLSAYTLNDYSELYGETFPTLDEVIETLIDTDVIFIFELKLDNGSPKAVSELAAVKQIHSIISAYEGMKGRWIAITFFAPYAKQMREICPEIPVGFLGYATADNGDTWQGAPTDTALTNISGYVDFLRKNNVALDMTLTGSTYSTAQAYLARGYVQNTWTFTDTSHFVGKANIATTDAAEKCAFLVKEVCPEGRITATAAEIASGKITAPCRTYNGWAYDYECKIIVVDGEPSQGSTVTAVLYYLQQGDVPYGIYSRLVTVSVA